MSDAATIADSLAQLAAPVVGANVRRWTERLLDAASAELLPRLPTSTQGLVAAALAEVKRHEDALASVSEHGFLAIVHHLALGDEDTARQVWLSGSADHRARMDALDGAFKASQDERDEHADLWATVKDAALAFIKAGGPAALSFLLGFVAL